MFILYYYMLLYNSIFFFKYKIMLRKLKIRPIASYSLSWMLKYFLASLKFEQWAMICLMEKFSLHVGHRGGSVFAIRSP